ncbi:anti-phage-associated DUF1156 domain-containing protein [Sphingobium limneticum]|nr:anti-phage-associated DUF1156 domain-containing protein [Sphingobium limneticum]
MTTLTNPTESTIVPFSMVATPSFIERVWPAQKISKESEAERKSVSSQTLTGLGGYWKGRKPLILNRACILGALLPATEDAQADLAVFERLMMMDDHGFVLRGGGRSASEYARLAITHGVFTPDVLAQYFERRVGRPMIVEPISSLDMEAIDEIGRNLVWATSLREDGWRDVAETILAHVPYEQKVDDTDRPEYLEAAGYAGDEVTWQMVNSHLGTSAQSIPQLVEQLGVMRFGRLPKIGDAFSGSGQIPYEALRTGCDSFASDQNPIAALLTWSSFELAGSAPDELEKVVQRLAGIARQVETEMVRYETNSRGDRIKALLYCVEIRCPETGYLIPLAPNWTISPKMRTVGRLVANHSDRRMDIEIVTNATDAEMKAAETGTVDGDYVTYQLDGETHRFSISRSRGDRRDGDIKGNLLRRWNSDEIVPRADDIFGERLYCIQWATRDTLEAARQTVYYAAPCAEDMEREDLVQSTVEANLAGWRADGLVPDMPIEPGLKTDDPIRTRGWSDWLHLFNPRQILVLSKLHAAIRASDDAARLYFFMPRALDNNSRLNRWKPSQGGGLGGVVGTFDNQALNTLFNFAVRGSIGFRSLVAGPARSQQLNGPRRVETVPGNRVSEPRDIWVTDPPYGDAVVYHELTEFFISWLRKNPPAPFDTWTWDSRRPLAIQGEGEDFRRKMVETYGNLTKLMPDNGMQIVMFTHQSGSVWADLALIFWGAGLQVSAAWYIATETGSNAPGKRGVGLVQGTVILVLRKRNGNVSGYEDEIVQDVRAEVAHQIDTLFGLNQSLKGAGRIENLFEDADLQMAGYAAALRVLTGYTSIDGKDMTAEALRPRRKNEVGFVDRMIDYAVSVANEHMVPDGLTARLWQQLSGPERFYLKMLSLESNGLTKLDNYQNFARAFRVGDHGAFMASSRPNEARLKNAIDFGSRTGFDIPEFGTGLVRAVLFAIEALQRELEPEVVLLQLRDIVPEYFKRRQDIVEIAEYVSRQRGRDQEEGRNAAVLSNLLRNERL